MRSPIFQNKNHRSAITWERYRIEYIFDIVAKNVIHDRKDIASLKAIIDNLCLEGKSVLEVGCGTGDNLIYCIERGAEYGEGFDISGESINKAKEKSLTIKNINFHKNSIEEYQAKRNFNVIIAWGVFEYFDNPLAALKEMCNWIKVNGILILLISRATFLKKISFIFRNFLSKFPLNAMLPIAKCLAILLSLFSGVLKKRLYIGESGTYSLEQTILEGLMIPRYNIFNPNIFTNYLFKNRFSIKNYNGVTPSMVCIIANKKD